MIDPTSVYIGQLVHGIAADQIAMYWRQCDEGARYHAACRSAIRELIHVPGGRPIQTGTGPNRAERRARK